MQKKIRNRRLLFLIIKLLKIPIQNKDEIFQRDEVGFPQRSILSPHQNLLIKPELDFK